MPEQHIADDGQGFSLNAEEKFVYTVNPTRLTFVLKVLLWIWIGTFAISAIVTWIENVLLEDPGSTTEELQAHNEVTIVWGILQTITVVITMITFLMWIRRANINVRGFGAEGLQYTPNGAIGYYAVPILNVFKPYQAMREIYNASINPRTQNYRTGNTLLVTWWSTWLVAAWLGRLALRYLFRAETVNEMIVANKMSITSNATNIVLGLVALELVITISNSQQRLVTQGAKTGS